MADEYTPCRHLSYCFPTVSSNFLSFVFLLKSCSKTIASLIFAYCKCTVCSPVFVIKHVLFQFDFKIGNWKDKLTAKYDNLVFIN